MSRASEALPSGEMVDVRLLHFRLGLLAGLRQAEGVEAGEAGGVCVGRRQGVGAEGEKSLLRPWKYFTEVSESPTFLSR